MTPYKALALGCVVTIVVHIMARIAAYIMYSRMRKREEEADANDS